MKKTKLILKIFACIALVLALTAGYLFYPLKGEKHVELFLPTQEYDSSKIQTVEKQADQPFKILFFADFQLWTKPGDNKKAMLLAKDMAAKTQPDLIILGGDNVSSLLTNIRLKQLIRTMEEIGIPWAPIFGNHDAEGKASLNWQGDRFLEAEHCLYQKGPSNLYGAGNYVLQIQQDGKPFYALYLLDNGRNMDYGGDIGKQESYVSIEQMAWYRYQVEHMMGKAGMAVPSLVFTHFPMPEMCEAIAEHAVKNENTGYYDIPAEYGFGSVRELPQGAPLNSGFVDLCKQLGSTKAFFCGHHHCNDASVIDADGIRYTYGLKAGPSPEPWNDATRYGATLITLESGQDDVVSMQIDQIEHSKPE